MPFHTRYILIGAEKDTERSTLCLNVVRFSIVKSCPSRKKLPGLVALWDRQGGEYADATISRYYLRDYAVAFEFRSVGQHYA